MAAFDAVDNSHPPTYWWHALGNPKGLLMALLEHQAASG